MSTSSASNVSASGNAGSRLSEVKDLKILKSPEEGGTEKDYQDFLDKIENHVTMAWDEGADIGQIVSSGELPDIDEPEDITDEDEKSKLKQRLCRCLRSERYCPERKCQGSVCSNDKQFLKND